MNKTVALTVTVNSKDSSRDMERAILENIVKYHIVPELKNLNDWCRDHLSTATVEISVNTEE